MPRRSCPVPLVCRLPPGLPQAYNPPTASIPAATRRLDLGLMDTGIILMIKSALVLIVYFVYKTWAFTTDDENQDLERKDSWAFTTNDENQDFERKA